MRGNGRVCFVEAREELNLKMENTNEKKINIQGCTTVQYNNNNFEDLIYIPSHLF